MQLQNIRVGNFIQNKDTGEIIRVTEVNGDYSNYEGIPFSKEWKDWLDRNPKDNHPKLWFFRADNNTTYVKIADGRFSGGVIYTIHEFQNFYYQETGKELVIGIIPDI